MTEHEMRSAEPELSKLTGAFDAAPPARERMLAQVYLHSALFNSATSKEKHMSLIERLFAGRNWTARIAIAALLLSGIAAVAVLAPPEHRSLAATDGSVLVYDLGSSTDVHALVDKLRAVKTEFAASLPKGAAVKLMVKVERKSTHTETRSLAKPDGGSTAPPADAPVQTERRIDTSAPLAPGEQQTATASFLLTGVDDKGQAKLAEMVAKALPQLAAPKHEDATWFSKEGGPGMPNGDGGIVIKLGFDGKEHQFVFPKGSSESEIESTINDWLKQNRPDFQNTVKVQVTGTGDQRQVEVRIESKKETTGKQ